MPFHPLDKKFVRVYKDPPINFTYYVQVAASYVEFNDRLLLLKRSELEFDRPVWGVPAGKVEADESVLNAAKRELFEETKIDYPLSQFNEVGTLYIEKANWSYVYHMFHIKIYALPEVKLNSEHTDHKWVTHKEMFNMPLILGAAEIYDKYLELKNSVS